MGLLHLIPTIAPQFYLTLTLRGLGFDTFQTNLLVIPTQALKSETRWHFLREDGANMNLVITMLTLAYFAERTKQLSIFAAVPQLWALPFLIFLRVINITTTSKWLVWAMLTGLIAAPMSMFHCRDRTGIQQSEH
jgi:hypothetical protein